MFLMQNYPDTSLKITVNAQKQEIAAFGGKLLQIL